MADDEKARDEPFLRRWARRKTEAASDDPASDDAGVDTASIASAPPAAAPSDEKPATDEPAKEEIDLSALPDIDSLDERSDFSVFMQDGIPEELRTRALQRLWRLDPSFGHVDGLLEYGEDFAGSGLAAEAVNSVYKVGKGMLSDDDSAAETDTADADANTGAADRAAADTTPGAGEDTSAETPPGDTDGGPEWTG